MAWKVGEKGLRFSLSVSLQEEEDQGEVWGQVTWVVGFVGASLEGLVPVFVEEDRNRVKEAGSTEERLLVPSTRILGRLDRDTLAFGLFDVVRRSGERSPGVA